MVNAFSYLRIEYLVLYLFENSIKKGANGTEMKA